MTVKLARLKSGEEIVADVKEMINDNKVVGYFFKKPCVVRMKNIQGVEAKTEVVFDISLTPWVPLGKGPVYPVAMDWIMTFVDPIDKLMEAYKTQILEQDDEAYGEVSDNDYGFDGPDSTD
tara:strand:+ start:7714 stop:8076 length:363 start_codon:yes stop_codon:yes gene_type:complete